MAPTPATAATITMENRALLGIAIETTESPSSPTKRLPPTNRHSGFIPTRVTNGLKEKDPTRPVHGRQASSPSLSFPEMLSRGFLERGESLGFNKTLLSAVSELKVRANFAPLLRRIDFFEEEYPRYFWVGEIPSTGRIVIPTRRRATTR